MAFTLAYPPTVILANSSKPIQIADAQQLVASYLFRSETNPYLHPDAILQPSGPTFSVQGGPQGGLVLHQLRRVEAGLRGEILKPDLKVVEQEGDDSHLDALIAKSQDQMEEQDLESPAALRGMKRGAQAMDVEATDGIIDAEADSEEMARQLVDSDDEVNVAEGAATGEMGDRSNLVEDGGDIPEVKSVPKSRAEKDAKKAAKKARRQQEKKDKAAQRLVSSAAHQTVVNGASRAESSPEVERQVNGEEDGKKRKKKKSRKHGED